MGQIENFFVCPNVAKSLPCWLFQFRKAKLRQPTGQRLSNVRGQQKEISIVPILFLCYEESLVSSNLNSKQLKFHGAHPTEGTAVRDFDATSASVRTTYACVYILYTM